MKQLFLEDLKGFDDIRVKNHIAENYDAKRSKIDKYDILIAYESVGAWGCDSSSFFLLRDKSDGKLYQVHGSHCSCYGFEDQFKPEESSIEYLKSGKFYFSAGGYDGNETENQKLVSEFIAELAD